MIRWLPLWVMGCLILAGSPALSAPPLGLGQPPKGLAGGGGLVKIDGRALAFESDLLKRINALRRERKLTPMLMNTRLRAFARKEAELAARGDPSAGAIHDRVKHKGMAPYGYYLQTLYGTSSAATIKSLRNDKGMAAALMGEFANAGIGAFHVPADEPYFQVLVILTKSPDPMAGKPGLSKAQTDPVMQRAMHAISACYNSGLKRNPNLRGSVLFKIVIGAKGEVSDAVPLKSIGDGEFDVCAASAIRAVRFPAPYKGKSVTLNHPMAFSPPQGGKRLGKLSEAQIESTFGRARFSFKNCYEKRLKRKRSLRGTITIAMTVLASGAVTRVRVTKNETGDIPLSRCIVAQANELRFPRPSFDGEVELIYPLSFQPPTKE